MQCYNETTEFNFETNEFNFGSIRIHVIMMCLKRKFSFKLISTHLMSARDLTEQDQNQSGLQLLAKWKQRQDRKLMFQAVCSSTRGQPQKRYQVALCGSMGQRNNQTSYRPKWCVANWPCTDDTEFFLIFRQTSISVKCALMGMTKNTCFFVMDAMMHITWIALHLLLLRFLQVIGDVQNALFRSVASSWTYYFWFSKHML